MSNVRLHILLTQLASTPTDWSGLRNISLPISTLACYRSCIPTSMSLFGTAVTSLLPTATVRGSWTPGRRLVETTHHLTNSFTSSSTSQWEAPTAGLQTRRAASLGSIPAPTPRRISGMRKTFGYLHGRAQPWKSRRFLCGNNATATRSCKGFTICLPVVFAQALRGHIGVSLIQGLAWE
jgi:hypothetical protein